MCTSFTLGTPDTGLVYARTMEFTLTLNSEVIVIPAGTQMTGTDKAGNVGQGGLTWETTYGLVGGNALGLPVVLDGVNEKGLAGGMLNFPASAGYMEVSDEDQSTSVCSFEVIAYLLSTCADVEEAKAAAADLLVQGVPIPAYGGQIPAVHYCIHDAKGASIVIEHMDGQVHIHDNPITVMTNEPAFDFHLQNLAQYQTITNAPPAPIESDGMSFSATSSGDGTFGLPYGFLATSRFVRAFFLRKFAVPHKTPEEGVQIARHILNQFDIPPGAVITEAGGTGEGGGVAGHETTQWMSVVDQTNAIMYASTYEHPNLFKVDAKKACAAAKPAQISYIPMPSMDAIPELLPA